MSAMSDYLENKIRDHVLRNIAYTSPAAVYMSLYTVAPTDAGGGTEATGGSYARQLVTFVADGSTAGAATTSAAVTFGPMAAGTYVAAGIHDAVSAGNLLLWAALTSNKTVAAGDLLQFLAGDIDAVFQ